MVLHVCQVNTKIHGIIAVHHVILVVVLVMDPLPILVYHVLALLYYLPIRQEDTVFQRARPLDTYRVDLLLASLVIQPVVHVMGRRPINVSTARPATIFQMDTADMSVPMPHTLTLLLQNVYPVTPVVHIASVPPTPHVPHVPPISIYTISHVQAVVQIAWHLTNGMSVFRDGCGCNS